MDRVEQSFPLYHGPIEEDGPIRFGRDFRDPYHRSIFQTRGTGYFPYGSKKHAKHWFHENRDKVSYDKSALSTEKPTTDYGVPNVYTPVELNRVGRHDDVALQKRNLSLQRVEGVAPDIGGINPIGIRDDSQPIDDVLNRDATRFLKEEVALEDFELPLDFFVNGMRGRTPDIEASRRVKDMLALQKARVAEEKVGDGMREIPVNSEIQGVLNFQKMGVPDGLVRNPIPEDIPINNPHLIVPNEAHGRMESIRRIERSSDLVNYNSTGAVGGRVWRTY